MRYLFKIIDTRDDSVFFQKEQTVTGREDMVQKKIQFKRDYYSFLMSSYRVLKVNLKN